MIKLKNWLKQSSAPATGPALAEMPPKSVPAGKAFKISADSLAWAFSAALLLAASGTGAYLYQKNQSSEINSQAKAENRNAYLLFLDEIYEIVKANYWEKITDEQLAELYRLAAEKVGGKAFELKSKDKDGLMAMLEETLSGLPDEASRKEFSAGVGDVVLANLQPFGRSRLYTQKLRQDLNNSVNNIDPGANLYADLGVEKNSQPEEIAQAYQEKAKDLLQDKSKEGKEKLAQVNRAYEALKTPQRKERYDQSGIEPSVTYNIISPSIAHIRIKRFSPTTVNELVAAADEADKNGGPALNTLILDLRGNIGGAIDQLPLFLSPFIGPDREAYQYYRQGEKLPFRTVSGWLPSLVRYKKVAILIDENSQSSAEVMAASLKKYNVGVLIGSATKGWGTIERIFDIKTQIDPNEIYGAFLVHTITLRDDGQPIEGRGVEPAISMGSLDWEKQLAAYFNYPPLATAIKNLWESER